MKPKTSRPKARLDLYDRLDRRLAMIVRIAEATRRAATLPWESGRGRRARAQVEALMAELKRSPP